MLSLLAVWTARLLAVEVVAALPAGGHVGFSSMSARNSSLTAFNASLSTTTTSGFNSSTVTYLAPTSWDTTTLIVVSTTAKESLGSSGRASVLRISHLPTQTPSATVRFPATPRLLSNASLSLAIAHAQNITRGVTLADAEDVDDSGSIDIVLAGQNTTDGNATAELGTEEIQYTSKTRFGYKVPGGYNATNGTGNTLDLAEAFASAMSRFAGRQNISDGRWTSEICSPASVEDARKHLPAPSLAVLAQTCAIVGSNGANATRRYLSNTTGTWRYNISGLAPGSSLRRLSKLAGFALPQYGRGGCMDDFGYFEMTAANLEESRVWEWYQSWTQEARGGPLGPRFAAYGEVRLFGQVFLGDDDYDCGLEMGGCTRRPSCSSILQLYPGDRELTRKVYFVMKLHNTMNKVLKTYYDTLLTAHVNVGGYIEPIISTCTQRISDETAKTCTFIRTTITNVVDFITEIGITAITSSMMLGSPTATSLVPGKILDVPAPIFIYSKALRVWRMWNAKALGGPPKMSSLCEGLGMVKTDDPSHIQVLKSALLTMSQAYRKSLSANTRQLNRGTFFGGGPSVLSSMMASTIWANETGIVQVLTDPYQMEDLMTTAMKEGLMAAAYRAAKCFMKCTTHPQAPLFCAGFNDWEFSASARAKYGVPGDGHAPRSPKSDLEQQMRICPRPDKVCQIECWSQEKRGFSIPMHGFATVQRDPLNLDVQRAMTRLYEYYKAHGNTDPHLDWGADALGKLEGGAPRFWLPVCDSDAGYVHIADWGHQGIHLSDNVDRRAFPLSCGSYRSDETEEFIRAVGIGNYDSKATFPLDPFYKVYAPKTLSSIIEAPLDSFLAFCALGIAYPQDSNPLALAPFRFQRSHSRFCEPIIAETTGMDWYVANLHFCERSEAAQELFRAQRPTPARRVAGMGGVVGHEELCRRWASSENARFVRAGDEVGKGNQGKGGRGYFVGMEMERKGKGNGNKKGKGKGNKKGKGNRKKNGNIIAGTGLATEVSGGD